MALEFLRKVTLLSGFVKSVPTLLTP
jgi:hypothetical protein